MSAHIAKQTNPHANLRNPRPYILTHTLWSAYSLRCVNLIIDLFDFGMRLIHLHLRSVKSPVTITYSRLGSSLCICWSVFLSVFLSTRSSMQHADQHMEI